MVIDTHVHFWQYDKKRDAWITDKMKMLQQDYLPQTIAGTFRRNGIDGCIAVQADQSELETLFLKELAKSHEIIKGVVGWIDLQNEKLKKDCIIFLNTRLLKDGVILCRVSLMIFYYARLFKEVSACCNPTIIHMIY